MMIRRRLILCFLLTLVFFVAGAVITGEVFAGSWFNEDWSYRKQITINSSQVPGNLTNFPVLINKTDPNWRDTANGGNVGQSDGGDILFTSSDGVTKLSHEIEKYGPSTGELVAWVNVPAVSSSPPDTFIYIYYGNTIDPTNQWNINGTWDDNFKMVQHLNETSGQHLDSTSNNNDSDLVSVTTQGSATGQIDGADQFVKANSDYIRVPRDSSFEPATTISIVGWIKTSYSAGVWNPILDHKTGADGYQITLGGGWINWWGGGFNEVWGSTAGYNDGNWHMFAVTYDGSIAELRWYKDGAPDGTWTTGASSLTYANYPLFIGYEDQIGVASDIYFHGKIDEVRISDIVRSPDWIETSFNNQNSPSSFLSFSAPMVFTHVPTMTELGMIIFMVLAGLGAIYYLRRQKVV